MNTQIIFKSNRKSTERMQQIIHGLSEEELSRTIGNNWSIAVTLAHLAFWDQRVIHVIETAKKNNVLNAPLFDDQLNDILAPILEAIPPAEAARMAVKIAGTLDRLLEECPPELINQMMMKNNRLVERSLHRNNHLDEIESMMKGEKNQ
jgi:uncharacterized damage-inducible protein DinB